MTGQGAFTGRLRKEFEVCRSIVIEKRDEISLRGVREMLAERLKAPQSDIDNEKELVARLVDEALEDRAESLRTVSLLDNPLRAVPAKLSLCFR